MIVRLRSIAKHILIPARYWTPDPPALIGPAAFVGERLRGKIFRQMNKIVSTADSDAAEAEACEDS
jgi:hypothetical protein